MPQTRATPIYHAEATTTAVLAFDPVDAPKVRKGRDNRDINPRIDGYDIPDSETLGST